MSTDIQKNDLALQFHDMAAGRLHTAADMTVHELVDEFLRLTAIINARYVKDEHGQRQLDDAGEIAWRERQIINGASRARFGLELAHSEVSSRADAW